MNPRRDSFIAILLPLLIGISLIGLFVVSYRFTTHNRGEERFLVYWAGMRAWLVDGDSPYSDAAASRIQELAVHTGDPNARVTYPLYGGFIILPFAAIPSYALARALWMTALGAALLVTALLCLRLTGWRTSAWLMALFLLLGISSYPSLSMMISGNATILAALFIVAALDALRLERDTTAGAMLGMATIQPGAVVVVLPFILLWCISRQRWLVVTWFFGLLAVLSVIGIFFIPDWIVQWLRNLLHYSDYLAPASPGVAFQNWWPGIGRQAGLFIGPGRQLVWRVVGGARSRISLVYLDGRRDPDHRAVGGCPGGCRKFRYLALAYGYDCRSAGGARREENPLDHHRGFTDLVCGNVGFVFRRQAGTAACSHVVPASACVADSFVLGAVVGNTPEAFAGGGAEAAWGALSIHAMDIA